MRLSESISGGSTFSFLKKLNESVELSERYETFNDITVGEDLSNDKNGSCKLCAVRAYMNDNAEDIYVGTATTKDGVEITHWFNVKDGKVIDHSYQANHDELDLTVPYKGLAYSIALNNKGFRLDDQNYTTARFIDDSGNYVEANNLGNKIVFKLNDEEISYEDLLNL